MRTKSDPDGVSVEEIIAAVEQLYVRDKLQIYRWLRRDPSMSEAA